MPRIALLGSVATVVGSLALSATAYGDPKADEMQKRAVESFEQAKDAFKRNEFAAAAAAFEQAAEFAPGHAVPILDAAEAWQNAGEPVRAAEDCDRVLTIPNVEPNFVNDAQERLRAIATKIATLDIRGPRTMNVTIDGGVELNVPLRRRVVPGHHSLVLVDLRTLKTTTLEVDLASASTRSIDAAELPTPPADVLAKPPRADPPREARPTHGLPAGAWIGAGVAGTSAIVAIVLGEMTLRAQKDYNLSPNQNDHDTFHRDKAITNVAWGVAAAAAVTGAAIWIATPMHQQGVAVGVAPDGVRARVCF